MRTCWVSVKRDLISLQKRPINTYLDEHIEFKAVVFAFEECQKRPNITSKETNTYLDEHIEFKAVVFAFEQRLLVLVFAVVAVRVREHISKRIH